MHRFAALTSLVLAGGLLASSCGQAHDAYVCDVPGTMCVERDGISADDARRECAYTPSARFGTGSCPSGEIARCTQGSEGSVGIWYLYAGYEDGSRASAERFCQLLEGDLSVP